jgi:predicted MFS family arabinose efflux permease
MATIELPTGVRGPRSAVRYASANKVPAALLLFGAAAGIAAARQGHLPDRRQAAGLLIAAIILVIAAGIVPDVVVAFLFALIIVQAIESADVVTGVLDRILSLLTPSSDATSRIASGPLAGHPLPGA